MERFIPIEKKSKKARKAENAKRRILWEQSPVTRKTENKKAYNRKKVQRIDRSDLTEPFSLPDLRSGRSPAANPVQAASVRSGCRPGR